MRKLEVPHPAVDDPKQTLNLDRLKAWARALQDEIDALAAGTVPDATASVKGKLKLAGDLGGTADAPTVPGLAGKASSSDLSNHASATTSVHGITDSSKLVYDDDPALTDARTPTVHAASHKAGGSDALRLNELQTPNGPVEGFAAATGSQFVTRGQMEQADLDVMGGYRRLPDVDFCPQAWTLFGAALPPHTRSGNVLTGNTNGGLTAIVPGIAPVVLGDTVLVVGDGPHNGLYECTQQGALGSSPWKLTRLPDFDTTGDLLQNDLVRARVGGRQMVLASPDPITINTTSQMWEDYTFFPSAHGETHGQGGSDPIPVQAWVEVGSPGAPAFTNSWANSGGGTTTAAFYKDPNGVVHLKGRVVGGSSNTTAFTLPAGYRPPGFASFGTVANNAFGVIAISSGGAVNPSVATWISLDGISFRAA